MHLSLGNFLTQIKGLVTGGGRNAAGQATASSGFLKDVTFPLASLSTQNTITDNTGGTVSTTLAAIAATTPADLTAQGVINGLIRNAIASLAAQLNLRGLDASETNLLVQSFPASTTSLGAFSFVVPRDYDEATDTFAIKLGVASAGATDTPGITATVYRKRPGAAIATVATAVDFKVPGASAAGALTANSQVLEVNLSAHGLQRDDALTIVLTSGAHTTDAILVYSIEPVYRSTFVSYWETNTTNAQTGVPLR